jgi:hypothetical protein
MDGNGLTSAGESLREFCTRLGMGALKLGLKALRQVAYAVFAVARPYIVFGLVVLSAGLTAVWFIFAVLAHDTEFHTFRVLGGAILCPVLIVVYCTGVELLNPR